MEIKISHRVIFLALYILAWILFVGLCIEACAFIISECATLVLNPDGAARFWHPADLSAAYWHNSGTYVSIATSMSIVAVLKAIIFFLIVRLLYRKRPDMARPFDHETGRFLSLVSYLALGIGLFASMGTNYVDHLTQENVVLPELRKLGIDGADVWFFMGIVLLVLAQIFRRGIAIQSENELTV